MVNKDPEKRKESTRRYYLKHKEEIKKYRQENRDKILEQQKIYNQSEARKISKKKHYESHRDQVLQYSKEYNIKNRDKILEKQKEYNDSHKEDKKQHNLKRFRYKDKSIKHLENPRKGICFFCKFEAKTHIHHFEYDDNDPLKWTIEICKSCHSRWHRLYDTPEGYVNPNK